jgi:O-antigen ligase
MSSIIFIGASLLGLWLLANAASRISIVSYFGAISLALLLIKRAYYIPVVALLILIVAGTSLSLVNRYESIYDVLIKKVHAAELSTPLIRPTPTPTLPPRLEDRSTNIRLDVEWPRAIRALTKNPLLGTGYSSITLATDNEYLRSLGEVGILGTLSFLLCFVLVLGEIVKGFFGEKKFTTKKLLIAGAIGMLAGSFLNMVFIDILEASKFAIMFWLFLGITISHMRYQEST